MNGLGVVLGIDEELLKVIDSDFLDQIIVINPVASVTSHVKSIVEMT